jgi:hypothetical protein
MKQLEADREIDFQKELLIEEPIVKEEPIADINIKHRRPKWIK